MHIALKITIGVLLAVSLGFGAGFVAHPCRPQEITIEQHWAIVRSHIAYLNNPVSYHPERERISSLTSPVDRLLKSSLAALVDAGALDHVDLVLPTVPNRAEANRYWMRFCSTNQAFVYATDDYPPSKKFRTAGNPPL